MIASMRTEGREPSMAGGEGHREILRPGCRAPAGLAVALLAIVLAFAPQGAWSAEQTSNGLSIRVMGARPHLTVGQDFSLLGVITNNTGAVVYLSEEFLRLKVPLELEGPKGSENSFWYGMLPVADPHARTADNNYHATIPLPPGQATPVWFFWDPQVLGCTGRQKQPMQDPPSWVSCADFLVFFVPGNYQLTVTADYWAERGQVGNSEPGRCVEATSLDVAAPLLVILLGAAIGGIIAFRILPQPQSLARGNGATPRSYWYWLSKTGALVGTVLLALIIAILWARLSDAVALIRVTVSDLWGGIAVGFIGNYFGLGLVDRMTKGKVDAKKDSGSSRNDRPKRA